ncbi:MAG: hypothetical protein EPO68_05315 [Planctomycetota bacterium]|nr:MAG: hypothetical protein EPO68_05315 [Planctomycetota bacterium]
MQRAQDGRRDRNLALALAACAAVIAVAIWWLSRAAPTGDVARELADETATPQRDATASGGGAVALEPRPARSSAANAQRPSSPQPAPAQPSVPAASSLVAGIVRDARTGEPVPELTVELSGGDVRETCTTDAAGRFASAAEFPAREVRADLSDLGWPVGVAKLEQPRLPFEIAVRIGPTYPLHLDPWTPGGAPQVRLVEHTTGRWAALLEVDAKHAFRFVRDDERDVGVALVRDGASKWVRFPHAYEAASESASAWLVLEDADGQRWCEIEAPGTEGIRPTARFDTSAALCKIAGRVVETGTRRSPWPARVCAVPVDREHAASLGWHYTDVNATDGSFELVGVRAGDWRVVAYADGMYAEEAYVNLLPEHEAYLDLRLVEPALDVDVVSVKDAEPELLWAATPRDLAPFHPPFVGVRTVVLLPRMQMNVLAWPLLDMLDHDAEPHAVRTAWNGSGRLSMQALGERLPLRFEVANARWIAIGPGTSSDGVHRVGKPLLVDRDENAPFMLGASQCQPMLGRIGDARREGGELVIDGPALVRGWGAQLLAHETSFRARPGATSDDGRAFAIHLETKRKVTLLVPFDDTPVPFGVQVLGAQRSVGAGAAGSGEASWMAELDALGIGQLYVSDSGETRIGIALDRTRFRITDWKPYLDGTLDDLRKMPGLHRYSIACERREKAQPAKPPARVDEQR